MAKKFELFDGPIPAVEKRMQGRAEINVQDVKFYSEDRVPKAVVLSSVDGGHWPFAPVWGFKEWTIEEWDKSSDAFYGAPLDEEWNALPHREKYEQIGQPLYFLNPREGVSVIQFHAYFDYGVPEGDAGFTKLQFEVNIGGNAGNQIVYAKVVPESIANWPEDTYDVQLNNGGGTFVNWSGTKAELLDMEFTGFDPETQFQYYITGSVESEKLRAYLYYYNYGNELGTTYPTIIDQQYNVPEAKTYYVAPVEVD